jgi:hypothetical protein
MNQCAVCVVSTKTREALRPRLFLQFLEQALGALGAAVVRVRDDAGELAAAGLAGNG